MTFRNPVYLDLDLLVPLANFHRIEVMRDVQLTERSVGGGEFGGKVGGGLLTASASGRRESEVTQSEVVTDHPISALNRLVEALMKSANIADPAQGVSKGDTVELELEWELSPLGDVGATMSLLFQFFAQNPTGLASGEVPSGLIGAFINGVNAGPAILEADEPNLGKTLVMIDRANLIGDNSLDRIEGGATVLGQVERLVGPGSYYSLQPYLTPGLNRSMRRSLTDDSINDLLTRVKALSGGQELTVEDLRVHGPAVVLRAVAIY